MLPAALWPCSLLSLQPRTLHQWKKWKYRNIKSGNTVEIQEWKKWKYRNINQLGICNNMVFCTPDISTHLEHGSQLFPSVFMDNINVFLYINTSAVNVWQHVGLVNHLGSISRQHQTFILCLNYLSQQESPSLISLYHYLLGFFFHNITIVMLQLGPSCFIFSRHYWGS